MLLIIGLEEPCLHRQGFFDPSGENIFLYSLAEARYACSWGEKTKNLFKLSVYKDFIVLSILRIKPSKM